MNSIYKLLILIIFFMMACNNNPGINSNKNDKNIAEWFENGEWRKGLEIVPDASVDIKEFYRQFHLNESLWKKAFDYLRENDPDSLEPGKYELAGDSLFFIIDVYKTKNEKDARYESHRKYADIQYLISGSEKIGVTKLNDPLVLEPYDESKDIAFYDIKDGQLRLANQERFFLFFPEDAHSPCIKIDDNKEVKKIVFKVRID